MQYCNKRGQSQVCLNYAERQQFRRNQYCNMVEGRILHINYIAKIALKFVSVKVRQIISLMGL